ncbi:Acetylserotonin O-methyltransferase [Linum grandiflorum]
MVSSLIKREETTTDAASLEVELWSYALGFTKMAVVKCAIELGIGEVIHSHNPLTLSQLASILGCDPSLLFRVMRFLVHHRIFEEKCVDGTSGYVHTPLSRRLLTRQDGKTMIDVLLLESSPVMLAPWHYLSANVKLTKDPKPPPFEQAHGKSLFEYTETYPEHSKLFDDAMSNIAKTTVPAIVKGCPDLLDGLKTLVDVGGGNGTAASLLVKGFPWIHGISFDLPHVVKVAPEIEGVKHVGGDMFASVPKADAVFIMQVLHDWNDEECIEILKRCREAIISKENGGGGKVIIVEAVVMDHEGKDGEKEEFEQVRLMLDMVMMAHTTTGKERTLKEWEHVLHQAGFTKVTVTPIKALQSVIQAFPAT